MYVMDVLVYERDIDPETKFFIVMTLLFWYGGQTSIFMVFVHMCKKKLSLYLLCFNAKKGDKADDNVWNNVFTFFLENCSDLLTYSSFRSS